MATEIKKSEKSLFRCSALSTGSLVASILWLTFIHSGLYWASGENKGLLTKDLAKGFSLQGQFYAY